MYQSVVESVSLTESLHASLTCIFEFVGAATKRFWQINPMDTCLSHLNHTLYLLNSSPHEVCCQDVSPSSRFIFLHLPYVKECMLLTVYNNVFKAIC